MAQRSKIEWTGFSWNPVTGCSKVSEGCANCYAERMSKRLNAMGVSRYKHGFEVRLHPDLLAQPLSWKRPRVVFVNSMSDLFHESVPLSFIKDVFMTMNNSLQHTFQILTKRSSRLLEYSDELVWSKNIWMGVTVENRDSSFRIKHLRESGARTKFLSCEPLIGDLGIINLSGIDWVIVGGESGQYARIMQKEWATSLRDQCVLAGVPYFFKQWGGWKKKKNGRILDGKYWDEMPRLAHELA